MNKKEIAEIKRLFSPADTPLTQIRGCYVDGEKNRKAEMERTFFSIPEEEMSKYFEIFKKALSGKFERNMLNLKPKNISALLAMRNSGLKEDDIADEFYNEVIENLSIPESYYIILAYGVYDIPGKGSDGKEMFDASEDVYDFIICCICPAALDKPGLCYNGKKGVVENRIRDWIVKPPELGFLYPAFNDRGPDINGLLYYQRDDKKAHPGFAEKILGCKLPESAETQKECFREMIENILAPDFNKAREICESIREILEERKDQAEATVLKKEELRGILINAGDTEEAIQYFDTLEEEGTPLENVMDEKNFEIKTPEVTIHTSYLRADTVELRNIGGTYYFLVPAIEGTEVNGIRIRQPENQENQ